MFKFELDVLLFLQNIRTDILNVLLQGITMLGEEVVMVLVIAILYFCIDKKFAQKLFFVTVSSAGINGIIKNLVRFPRPFATGKILCVREDTATGYSFTSGHTQTFASMSTTIAKKLKKPLVTFLVGILIVLVAFSRMYLGAHYPSDVVVGAVLGVVLALIGTSLFDKVENKKVLYLATIILLTPFAIMFLINPDEHFEDFYKIFGMLIGFLFAVMFEEKYAPLEYNISWWKKVLRVVTGIVAALLIKEGIKVFNVFDSLRMNLVFDALRYGVIVFVTLGICPWIFKKIKI
ncbi:MAG: phosphatase PAP2 family protein [Clostridia bacterium]|nr:phosphatase PAP2 family protein [Clostridia bacterium]